MSAHHFRTEAEWRRWFDEEEQRAEQTALLEKHAGTLHYTQPIPIRVETEKESALSFSANRKPFPLRRRRGR